MGYALERQWEGMEGHVGGGGYLPTHKIRFLIFPTLFAIEPNEKYLRLSP